MALYESIYINIKVHFRYARNVWFRRFRRSLAVLHNLSPRQTRTMYTEDLQYHVHHKPGVPAGSEHTTTLSEYQFRHWDAEYQTARTVLLCLGAH